MPLHHDIESLVPACREKCRAFLDAASRDKTLKDLGYVGAVLNETRRELVVQFAYAMRGRMTKRPEDSSYASSEQWVKRAFVKAGLWALSDDEARRPCTWTLDSKHIDGLAFDAGPSKNGRSIDWNAPDRAWEALHAIGKDLGLVCGADFPGRTKDSPHYEMP
jgi:hypothetical protein